MVVVVATYSFHITVLHRIWHFIELYIIITHNQTNRKCSGVSTNNRRCSLEEQSKKSVLYLHCTKCTKYDIIVIRQPEKRRSKTLPLLNSIKYCVPYYNLKAYVVNTVMMQGKGQPGTIAVAQKLTFVEASADKTILSEMPCAKNEHLES